MKKVGRPTKMDEITVKKLEDAYANDASDEQACFLANISKQTLYNYQELHPEFVDRKQALKDLIKYQAKAKIKEAINTEKEPNTSKWYLERKDKDFKPKQDVTSDDKPIPILNVCTSNSYNKDNGDEEENTGGSGGNGSEQDSINSPILDSSSTD